MTDGPNRQYLSTIRVAIRTGQRPTAAIFSDHFFGHRDSFTGEIECAPYWTPWDYSLANVFQMIEDYQDSETGRFPWEIEDENIRWRGRTKPNSYRAAVEKYQDTHKDKDGKSTIPLGDSVYAEIDWLGSRSAEIQKPSEWFKKQGEESAEHEKQRLELAAELARPENQDNE